MSSPAATTPLLELSRVEGAYGGIHAVKGIDLVVGAGELVCLIGANGAGKTTTLKGICGLPWSTIKSFWKDMLDDGSFKPIIQLSARRLSELA